MTEDDLTLYITDAESFLNGDRNFTMTVYKSEYFSTGVPVPQHWIAIKTFPMPEVPTREELTQIAVDKLKEEEKEALAEHQLILNEILQRKQKLLAIPHLTETIDD